ncbi:MAG: hypothetical protein JWO20_1724, partial [Candidatus Angelobacter sp.]|nr:hypothetical protein [Candidatus Angelobacter sp.]
MERKCKHPDCYVPETSCVMGNQDANVCEFWSGGNTAELDATETISDASGKTMVPWSGGAMGLSDVAFVAARGAPIVIGVVGPH